PKSLTTVKDHIGIHELEALKAPDTLVWAVQALDRRKARPESVVVRSTGHDQVRSIDTPTTRSPKELPVGLQFGGIIRRRLLLRLVLPEGEVLSIDTPDRARGG